MAGAVRRAGEGLAEKFRGGTAPVEALREEARAGIYSEQHSGVTRRRFAMDDDIYVLRRAAKSASADKLSLVATQVAVRICTIGVTRCF